MSSVPTISDACRTSVFVSNLLADSGVENKNVRIGTVNIGSLIDSTVHSEASAALDDAPTPESSHATGTDRSFDSEVLGTDVADENDDVCGNFDNLQSWVSDKSNSSSSSSSTGSKAVTSDIGPEDCTRPSREYVDQIEEDGLQQAAGVSDVSTLKASTTDHSITTTLGNPAPNSSSAYSSSTCPVFSPTRMRRSATRISRKPSRVTFINCDEPWLCPEDEEEDIRRIEQEHAEPDIFSPVSQDPGSPFDMTESPVAAKGKEENRKEDIPEATHVIALHGEDEHGSEGHYNEGFGDRWFMHGVKPVWGWDFVMTFSMPKALLDEMEGTNSTHREVSGGDDNSGVDSPATYKYKNEGQDNLNAPGGFVTRLASGQSIPPFEDRSSSDHTRDRAEILARLKSAGFVISQLLVPDEKVIIVRLSLTEEKLHEKAVNLGLNLQLISDYGGGYLSYDPAKRHCYVNSVKQEAWGCYFSPAERARIIMGVLESKEFWGCDLDVQRLIYHQVVFQAFPLHSLKDRDELVHKVVWHRWWNPSSRPPVAELKDYLGGKFLVQSVSTISTL